MVRFLRIEASGSNPLAAKVSLRAGVPNLSETKSHNFPCAAAKSHMRHVGTNVQKSSVYFQ